MLQSRVSPLKEQRGAGEGEGFCDGHRFPLAAGDVVVFPPRSTHGIDVAPSGRLYALVRIASDCLTCWTACSMWSSASGHMVMQLRSIAGLCFVLRLLLFASGLTPSTHCALLLVSMMLHGQES